jgi:hypothetical protein
MKNNIRNAPVPKSYRHKVKQVLSRVRAKYNVNGNFTELDFYRICESEKILLANQESENTKTIYEKVPALKGVICTAKDGTKFIYLRCFFYKIRRFDLFTAFHELGHHFLEHRGTLNFLADAERPQREIEADLFAEFATNEVPK